MNWNDPETAKNAPKSGQKTAQSVPNLSKIEPKTLLILFFKALWADFFPNPNLHNFSWIFFTDFYEISRAGRMKNIGFF